MLDFVQRCYYKMRRGLWDLRGWAREKKKQNKKKQNKKKTVGLNKGGGGGNEGMEGDQTKKLELKEDEMFTN